MTDDLTIEPLNEAHFDRLHAVFDAVCRERRFMAFTQGGPREEARAYYLSILDAGDAHVVALRGNALLGWCDVLRQRPDARRHVGTLGMAVRADARGQGLGRALITAALAGADARGLTRVELTVHPDNQVAQRLYRSVGFVLEGVQRGGWRMDGRTGDLHAMARVTEAV